MTRKKLVIKNLLCDCCYRLLQRIAADRGIELNKVSDGEVEVLFDPTKISLNEITELFSSEGFEIVTNREQRLVEQIKQAVINLVHQTTFNAMVRNSDFLVEKFGMSYPYMSALFSKHEHLTLEKFIILQKIEKIKSLIRDDELTLSEIAYMMGYSSVHYLSNQFRAITGISVTDYKKKIKDNLLQEDELPKQG